MSICQHRMAETEFWTPCSGCRCGKEVAEAQIAAQEAAQDASSIETGPGSTVSEIGPQIEETETWSA
jgi:hypothetical protein